LRRKTPKLNEVEPNAYKIPRQLATANLFARLRRGGSLSVPFYHKFSKSKIATDGK
jgi:hypothetical protein